MPNPAIHIDVQLDVDGHGRPLLCGRLNVWLWGAAGTLEAGQIRHEVIAVDGWSLTEFATKIYDLTASQGPAPS